MSDQVWAVEQMMKHEMIVHFNAGVISCLSSDQTCFHHERFDVGDSVDFYNALQRIVREIG